VYPFKVAKEGIFKLVSNCPTSSSLSIAIFLKANGAPSSKMGCNIKYLVAADPSLFGVTSFTTITSSPD